MSASLSPVTSPAVSVAVTVAGSLIVGAGVLLSVAIIWGR